MHSFHGYGTIFMALAFQAIFNTKGISLHIHVRRQQYMLENTVVVGFVEWNREMR